ncbi:ENTH domain [Dillenia turbinata]|uniref:ENTH domain n=1 Tax=Dillenia turbinata TaxID=194707 RepID=A0AAN8VL11_9MAGN
MSNSPNNMTSPSFRDIKSIASLFLKEKYKTLRLALLDVTEVELLTEEAIDDTPSSPDTRTLKLISRAAFEVNDYDRIVKILHKRLSIFDKKSWRISYKVLILLEFLLTHGPQRVAEEFQSNRDVIMEMGEFEYVDEKGFDWGAVVRKKSQTILSLLEGGQFLKEERARARKLTRGIQGIGGSFCEWPMKEESLKDSSFNTYARSKSLFIENQGKEDEFWTANGINAVIDKLENNSRPVSDGDELAFNKYETRTSLITVNSSVQKETAVAGRNPTMQVDHPFNEDEEQSSASLLTPTR